MSKCTCTGTVFSDVHCPSHGHDSTAAATGVAHSCPDCGIPCECDISTEFGPNVASCRHHQVCQAIQSDEEIERKADSFNIDSDDWGSYVNHAKGYRDGLLASRSALAPARQENERLRGIINELQLAMFEDEQAHAVTLRRLRDVFKRAKADAAAPPKDRNG